MYPATDSPAEHFTQSPRFTAGSHESVKGVLGGLVVHGTNAAVASSGESGELALSAGLGEVGHDGSDLEVRSPLTNPIGSEFGFSLTDARVWKHVPVDVVGFVDVVIDERYLGNAWIAGEQVENDHPAAPGTDLEEMHEALAALAVFSVQFSVFS
jgi:hypothetical protein